MKLSLTLTDERTVYKQYGTDETNEYDRAAIEGATGSGAVLAAILRGIANEIDPSIEDCSAAHLSPIQGLR